MAMNIQLENLRDEELQYLVSNDIDFFMEPIKQSPKNYMQYSSLMGMKNKKSILIQKQLPIIATKLYRKQDRNYVRAMEMVAEKHANVLIEYINNFKGQNIPLDITQKFSDEELADIIKTYQKGEIEFDYRLFWIQLKLVGVPNIEERRENILLLCGVKKEEKEIDDKKENMESVKQETKKKKIIVVDGKNIKSKKITAEEKAAKTRMANEAKEKRAKLSERPVQEAEKTNQEDKKQELSSEKIDKSKERKDKFEEEHTMGSSYIGVIQIKNSFYNFTPIGFYENRTYTAYTEKELDELLPKSNKHNINFTYNFWDGNQSEFMKEKFIDGQLVLLNCEISELEENRTPDGRFNDTGYKIQALEAWNKGKISSLSRMGMYIVLPKDALMDDIAIKRVTHIEYEGIVAGEKVLVNLGDGFFAGPFTVKYAPTNGTWFIVMEGAEGKHIINGYHESDCERVLIEPSYSVESWIGYSSWTYYVIKEDAVQIVKDVISDKDLLDSFKTSLDKSENLDYEHLDIEGIIENLDTSQIVGSTIPDQIREQRIERIRHIMSSQENLMRIYSDTSDIICELLLKNKDSVQTQQLLQEIIDKHPDLLDRVQSIRVIQSKVENERAKLEQLEAQRSEIEARVKNIQENSEVIFAKKDDIEEELSAELLAKKEELHSILSRLEVAQNAEALQEKISKLKEEVSYYDNHRLHLASEGKNLESKFVELVNGYSEKMADITFDGFMSSKMLQAAAGWEAKTENELLNDRVTVINNVHTEKMSKEEFINYLIRTINIARPGYNRNVIINILTCVAQGFLTVFSGMPGCGKTSICNIIAKVLGLNKYDGLSSTLKDISRFVSVSVERGWTSKRDFIGYYNPLTKTFEENNRNVFEGLRLLDMEQRKGLKKWPFIILLDEANLSPMEYYWADFMNVCDDLSDNSSINLGNNNVFHIPETLHFLATINNDHTTETLSPRLIDRAWIVSLPKNTAVQYEQIIPEDIVKNVTWDEIKSVFTIQGYEIKGFDRETQAIYEGLKERLLHQGIYISPRVDLAIQKYWVVASNLMEEDEYGNSSNVIAMDYAIAQKILPKINGSGDEYETWLEELEKYCDSKGMVYSAELLTSIINCGNKEMKYYQFFRIL
jgi:MoxR-like ATPase